MKRKLTGPELIVRARITLKNVIVDPASRVPYEISLWSARSSTESIGAIMRSTVRKAARLAVYDEMMMSVKNHQMPPTMRVEAACYSKALLFTR